MESNTSKAAAVLGIVLALGLGIFGGYMIGMNSTEKDMNTSSTTQQSTKEADLRVGLNNLLREHVSSSLVVTRNIVDGASASKIEGAKAAQTANAVAIVYRQEASNAF